MKNDEAPMSVVAWLATCLENLKSGELRRGTGWHFEIPVWGIDRPKLSAVPSQI
jgi:hypothetical protein